jgi:uncharacterized membrane protein
MYPLHSLKGTLEGLKHVELSVNNLWFNNILAHVSVFVRYNDISAHMNKKNIVKCFLYFYEELIVLMFAQIFSCFYLLQTVFRTHFLHIYVCI